MKSGNFNPVARSKIMTMCLIYLLAGAFAVVSKAMGGVDAVVNLGISTIDVAYFPLGIFNCRISINCYRNLCRGNCSLGPIAVTLAIKWSLITTYFWRLTRWLYVWRQSFYDL
jgi:hypothetical protein